MIDKSFSHINSSALSVIRPSITRAYWSSVTADVTGVLGGFPHVHSIDINGSYEFLCAVLNTLNPTLQTRLPSLPSHTLTTPTSVSTNSTVFHRAVDCGAGIGRITLHLLASFAKITDLVEPVQSLSNIVRHSSDFLHLRSTNRIGYIWDCGLEDWLKPPYTIPASSSESSPSAITHDLVWIQWCLSYLADADIVDLLCRIVHHNTSRPSVNSSSHSSELPKLLIIIKENISSSGLDIYDDQESSLTRTPDKFRELFSAANLSIYREQDQQAMPDGLLTVRMWALIPVI